MGSRQQPAYFQRVREEAHRHWELLDSDPVLAAPWRQLFQQVRSPRHLLSELLQNADDAGATYARAEVDDAGFVFEHDGVDFDEDQFRSLCRFGYSNKRQLHTIGFRGLGFKAAFGCGPRVQLLTPTLAVEFNEDRFTEPQWLSHEPPTVNTIIRIPIPGQSARGAILEEFNRWAQSPVPLLFFSSIQRIELQGTRLSKATDSPGPVPRSAWVSLKGRREQRALHLWSEPEMAPTEVLEEVRRERGDQNFDLPPIRVDVVLLPHDKSRVYVVLPTDVYTPLPFHIQAPFLQDPARTGIKDPATSLTNRWLLQRTGQLAASAILGWLANLRLTSSERAEAYELVPQVKGQQEAISEAVASLVVESIRAGIGQRAVILASDGTLQRGSCTLDVPHSLAEVWNDEDLLRLLGDSQTHVISGAVKAEHRDRLKGLELLERFKIDTLVSRLRAGPRPRRPADSALTRLWSFLLPTVRASQWDVQWKALAIVPVVGSEELASPKEAMPLSVTAREVTEDDIRFLAEYATLVDPAWLGKLLQTEGGPASPAEQDARDLLRILKLDRPSDLREIIAEASETADRKGVSRLHARRLAYLSAKAAVAVPDSFVYFTADGSLHRVHDGILLDEHPVHGQLLPEEWKAAHMLHSDYHQSTDLISQQVWIGWARSERSGLSWFPRPVSRTSRIRRKRELARLLGERGGKVSADLPLKESPFELTDCDFDEALWRHWESLASQAPAGWIALVSAIASSWSQSLAGGFWVRVEQLGYSKRHSLDVGQAATAWIGRLRSLPCLPSDSNEPSVPSTLLRRLPENAFLEGIEPFVAARFESECPVELLDALGVRTHPESVAPIVERLRTEAAAEAASQPRIYDLYRALDRSTARMNEDQLQELQETFRREALIRAEDGTWQNSTGVFQRNPAKIPGAVEVWSEARPLNLWSRLGVEPVPTAGLVLKWLGTLPTNERLSDSDARRVRDVVARLPEAAWGEVRCWISVNGYWVRRPDLKYAVEDPSVCDGLFEPIRRATADGSMLSSLRPLTGLAVLEEHLTLMPTVEGEDSDSPTPAWLATLGRCIARIDLTVMPTDELRADQHTGCGLLGSRWRECAALGVTPMVDGSPAGSKKKARAAWVDREIIVSGPPPLHHSELVLALQRRFRDRGVREGVGHCVGRAPLWIEEYFADRWRLTHTEIELIAQPTPTPPPGTEPSPSPMHTVVASDAAVELAHQQPEGPTVSKRAHERVGSGPRWLELLAQFLRGNGFVQSGEVFRHAAGDVIRMREGLMHATRYGPSGELIAEYWATDEPLDQGIEIPAEVWHSMRAAGEIAYLIAPTPDGEVGCYRVADLLNTVDEFPSAYRIRRRSE